MLLLRPCIYWVLQWYSRWAPSRTFTSLIKMFMLKVELYEARVHPLCNT